MVPPFEGTVLGSLRGAGRVSRRNLLTVRSSIRSRAAFAARDSRVSTLATALGLAVASVARMAISGRHREARDRPHLTAPRLPPALDVEESAPSGRPAVPPDVRTLIRTMSEASPLWGAPKIHGELAKLGIDVTKRRSRHTSHAASVRRHRHGGLSSPIMSIRSWPRTSSSCPPQRIDCCSCW